MSPAPSARSMHKGAAVLGLNAMANAVGGFVFWALAALRFSPEQVGAVAALTTAFPLVGAIAGLGMPETVMRHLAGWQSRRHLLRAVVALTAASGLVVGAAWFAIARDSAALPALGLAILAVLAATLAAGAVTDAANIALGRPSRVLAASTAGAAIKIATALVATTPVALFSGIALAAIVASALSAVFVFRSRLATQPAEDPELVGTPLGTSPVVLVEADNFDDEARESTLRDVLRSVSGYAAVNWVTALASLVPQATIVAIVAARQGPAAAAYVALPLMVLSTLSLLTAVVARSLFATASAEPTRLPALARSALRTALATTGTAAVAAALIGPMVLRLLGHDYADESATLVRLFALAAVVAVPNYIGDVTLNVRKDRLGYAIANLGGVAWLLICVAVGSGISVDAVGVAWVAGQLGYAVLVTSLVRCRRHVGAVPILNAS